MPPSAMAACPRPSNQFSLIEDHGQRTGFIFFDLKDTSQIPAVAEPWFLAFDAHVELRPAMNLEDLKKATPGIDKAVKNYRRMAHTKAA